jgi:hypothetical protein
MELQYLKGVDASTPEQTDTNTDSPTTSPSFWDKIKKHQTKLVVAGSILVVFTLGYFAYENYHTQYKLNSSLSGVDKRIKTHNKRKRRRSS